MAKKLTVHAKDNPRDSWVEVDGEQIEADFVQLQWSEEGGWQHLTVTTGDCEIVDERSRAEEG